MAIGTVDFLAPIKGLELDELKIDNPHPSIDKILVKTQDTDLLSIQFHLIDIFSKSEAKKVIGNFAELIINRLSFEFACPIGESRCRGMSLPTDQSGKKHIVIGEIVLMNDLLEGEIKPGKARLEKLRNKLACPYEQKDLYLSLFRFAIYQTDHVARFMFLYHLMLFMNKEDSFKVDTQICQIDPKIERKPIPKPRGKRKTQTIFRRLRMEIAHGGKTDLSRTRQEIEENVSHLQTIVKKAILNSFQDPTD